jgi:rubrerythrin
VTPAKTAELLAQFVASRTQPPSDPKPEDEVKKAEKKKAAVIKKIHTPLPKATQDLTQPIMYIDKKTGVLSVDMMWTCTKCSFAYNKVEESKCEVCKVSRSPSKEETSLDGDFQLVTADLIKVSKIR